jgi:transposase-like protein
VIAVLLYAFGLSLRKTSGFFWVLSEPLSKSSVQDWVKRVEAKLNFEATPSWHQAIAVDESVVKCGGRPIYV